MLDPVAGPAKSHQVLKLGFREITAIELVVDIQPVGVSAKNALSTVSSLGRIRKDFPLWREQILPIFLLPFGHT